MVSGESPVANLALASWALSDDQRGLRTAAGQFARSRLEPLLTQPPNAALWQETVRLAATLDLGNMILPQHMGGMAISRHDLALVVEQFAAGPIERVAELTLSCAALMTLRQCDALDRLQVRDVRDYFDGAASVALGIPDVDTSSLWLLRQHSASPAMVVQMEGDHPRLVLATLPANRSASNSAPVAVLGALSLERYCAASIGKTRLMVVPGSANEQGGNPVRQWLVETAIYLAALLSGAVQQSVNFALAYSVSRQTFRKPIAAHQLVAARLADMLVAAHSIHLFLRSAAAQDTLAQLASIRQMARHVATEAMDVARELVQLCGGHGYVEGLPPAARFQTAHWFAMLLMKVEAALRTFTASAGCTPDGESM